MIEEAEIWKVSPSFPLYAVSSLGRVMRLRSATCTRAGRILKASLHHGGYPHHGLSKDGLTRTVRLNRLVCEAFHGAAPDETYEAAHWDGNRLNSRSDNLYWATKLENAADKNRHGTTAKGSAFRSAKLTDQSVREIRAKRAVGVPYKTIAAEYGISSGLIGHVICGRNWKHVR